MFEQIDFLPCVKEPRLASGPLKLVIPCFERFRVIRDSNSSGPVRRIEMRVLVEAARNQESCAID